MFRVETRISDYELVEESRYTLPSKKIQNKVLADMNYFLKGRGAISSWRDLESNHTVIRGELPDY